MGLKGFKDFESVRIKATYDIETETRTIRKGETLAFFDEVQIAGLEEINDMVAARGGYGNQMHVIWDDVQELRLVFQSGVFSMEQLSLLANANLLRLDRNDLILTKREILESDENCTIHCAYPPIGFIYVYDRETGEKIEFLPREDYLIIDKPFQEVIVDYDFEYKQKVQTIRFGDTLLNGFVSVEGYTRIKDDKTGKITTGIIKIPRIHIESNMKMTLGSNGSPMVATFKGIATPTGERHSEYVCEFIILDEDIQADII